MKLKFLLILLVFGLFVGCNRSAGNESSAATTPADPASQSVAAESPIAVTPTVATAATATPGLSAEARAYLDEALTIGLSSSGWRRP